MRPMTALQETLSRNSQISIFFSLFSFEKDDFLQVALDSDFRLIFKTVKNTSTFEIWDFSHLH